MSIFIILFPVHEFEFECFVSAHAQQVCNQHGTGVRRGGVLLGLRGPDPQAQDSSYRRREAAAKERLAPQDGPSLGMRIWENRNCQNVAQTWIRGEV